jgi:ParB family chromosome partitioning protein
VGNGSLTAGHGRALLGLTDDRQMTKMAKAAIAGAWSVRDLEARVRGEIPGRRKLRRAKEPVRSASAEVRRVEDVLRERLKTDVRVTARRRGRGLVTISYYSNDDLARLLELMLGESFAG